MLFNNWKLLFNKYLCTDPASVKPLLKKSQYSRNPKTNICAANPPYSDSDSKDIPAVKDLPPCNNILIKYKKGEKSGKIKASLSL